MGGGSSAATRRRYWPRSGRKAQGIRHARERTDASQIDTLPCPRIINCHIQPHLLPLSVQTIQPRVIFMVRDPRDVVVSYYHHVRGLKSYKYEGGFSGFLGLLMEDKGYL